MPLSVHRCQSKSFLRAFVSGHVAAPPAAFPASASRIALTLPITRSEWPCAVVKSPARGVSFACDISTGPLEKKHRPGAPTAAPRAIVHVYLSRAGIFSFFWSL